MPPKDTDTATELATLTAKYEALVEDVNTKLQRITDGLWGSADDPGKGLLIRVDRLEQSEKRRDWYVRAAVGAAIAAMVGAVWGLVSHPQPAPQQQQPQAQHAMTTVTTRPSDMTADLMPQLDRMVDLATIIDARLTR